MKRFIFARSNTGVPFAISRKRCALVLVLSGLLLTGLLIAAEPSLMKAVVVHVYGGPEVLKFEEARDRSQRRMNCSSA